MQTAHKVAIVFYSGSGNTALIAEVIAEGANEINANSSDLIRLQDGDIIGGRYTNSDVMQRVDEANAIIMGSPTYMGGAAAQFKAFADASSERWAKRKWRNKWASGFSLGATNAREQKLTLRYFSILAYQHGMHWIGMDDEGHERSSLNGLGLGLKIENGIISEDDLERGRDLGRRVAKLAASKSLFA